MFGTGKEFTGGASYQKDIVFEQLPLKHHYFDEWESQVRQKIFSSTPAEFPHEDYFAALDADLEDPWVWPDLGADKTARKYQMYVKADGSVYGALMTVLRKAALDDLNHGRTLKWKLFHDKAYANAKVQKKEEQKIDPIKVGGLLQPPQLIDVGSVVTTSRAVQPEFNGHFLWCKMRKHVRDSAQTARLAAIEAFTKIGIRGDRILEFFATVERVGTEAHADEFQIFSVVRDRLSKHPKFRDMFSTWQITNRGSKDINSIREFYEEQETLKVTNFKPVYTAEGGRRYGGAYAATEGSEWHPDDPQSEHFAQQGEYDPYESYAAAGNAEDLEDDGPDGEDWIYDATDDQHHLWHEWVDWYFPEGAELLFATAGRFKGRPGKGGKKGFRSFRPRFRPRKGGKKGAGKGKGKSSYSPFGKGVAAPTEGEEWDPTAFYDETSLNAFDHFYWDHESQVPVYDPEGVTPIAAAAKAGRKGKKGHGGKGKGKGGGGKFGNTAPNSYSSRPKAPDGREYCQQWQEFRCKHGDKCKYSHAGPGSLAPKQSGKPGASATPGDITIESATQFLAHALAAQQHSQRDQAMQSLVLPAGAGQPAVPAGPGRINVPAAQAHAAAAQPRTVRDQILSAVPPEYQQSLAQLINRNPNFVASANLSPDVTKGQYGKGQWGHQ